MFMMWEGDRTDRKSVMISIDGCRQRSCHCNLLYYFAFWCCDWCHRSPKCNDNLSSLFHQIKSMGRRHDDDVSDDNWDWPTHYSSVFLTGSFNTLCLRLVSQVYIVYNFFHITSKRTSATMAWNTLVSFNWYVRFMCPPDLSSLKWGDDGELSPNDTLNLVERLSKAEEGLRPQGESTLNSSSILVEESDWFCPLRP